MTGKRILLIEDEVLVAMDMQSTLAKAGFASVDHAATEREALACIEEGNWDAAVADANLNGRKVTRVAAALGERGIPFVIVTGYGRESLPPEVAHVPVLNKPIHPSQLITAVSMLCAGPAQEGLSA